MWPLDLGPAFATLRVAMRMVSWNVNGLRAVHARSDLQWAFEGDADVVCLQETKIQPELVTDELRSPRGTWRSQWSHGRKKGYSGTAVFVRDRFMATAFAFPIGGLDQPEFDEEGRVVALDFGAFVLINLYCPNGASGPERLAFKRAWHDAFLDKVVELNKTRSVVVTGDFNIAHKEIDVAKPEAWSRFSGFLPEERAWLDRFLAAGFVDTFRAEKGDVPRQFTFWETRVDARRSNTGWRIDYFFISKDLEDKLVDAWISPHVMGSDHCPLGIELTVAVPVTEEWVASDEEPDEDGWRRR
jgi:exodeoxyribonuclease-3